MRHLVYRVQALPQSMLPLVWDFGQLDEDVERLYIKQMVNRCVSENYYVCDMYIICNYTLLSYYQIRYYLSDK